MGKYEALETDIFSIFGSVDWKAEKVKTFPSGFVAMNQGNEYIRVSIIPSGKGLNHLSASGVLLIDIFTPAGVGPKKSSLIADKLDKHLAGKCVMTNGNNMTQFAGSSLDQKGVDPDSPSLLRSTYTIPFNYFGVLQ